MIGDRSTVCPRVQWFGQDHQEPEDNDDEYQRQRSESKPGDVATWLVFIAFMALMIVPDYYQSVRERQAIEDSITKMRRENGWEQPTSGTSDETCETLRMTSNDSVFVDDALPLYRAFRVTPP